MTDEEGIVYLVFSMMPVLIAVVASGSLGDVYSAIAIIIALGAAVLLALLNWVDYLVVPAFLRTIGVRFRLAKDYGINRQQDAIIKNVNGLYYAVGFLTANVFAYVFKAEMIDEDIEQKIADAPETWERSLMGIDFPFKFHVLSANRDVQKARDYLEGRRSYVEFQMNRMIQDQKSSDTELGEMRRKLSVLQAQMDRISEGEKPISTVMYIETVAVGVTEKAATDSLNGQIERLQVALSSLDLQLSRVVGRELNTLFEFNFMLPDTYAAASSQFDMQG